MTERHRPTRIIVNRPTHKKPDTPNNTEKIRVHLCSSVAS